MLQGAPTVCGACEPQETQATPRPRFRGASGVGAGLLQGLPGLVCPVSTWDNLLIFQTCWTHWQNMDNSVCPTTSEGVQSRPRDRRRRGNLSREHCHTQWLSPGTPGTWRGKQQMEAGTLLCTLQCPGRSLPENDPVPSTEETCTCAGGARLGLSSTSFLRRLHVHAGSFLPRATPRAWQMLRDVAAQSDPCSRPSPSLMLFLPRPGSPEFTWAVCAQGSHFPFLIGKPALQRPGSCFS